MKILLVHNSYQQDGGEDEVFANERELLLSNGHEVVEYIRSNEEIRDYGIWDKTTLGLRAIWAWDSERELRELLKQERPDVAHFHNTFPLISPAAYSACQDAGVPVVQSLHNPRLLCPAATLQRDGHVCEDCVGKTLAWPGVLHGCYHDSTVQTGIVASMLTVHRFLKTWVRHVDAYIVFTEFYRRKFTAAGLPSEKIVLKPHFVAPDPGQTNDEQNYALFVGRLAAEKGVETLLGAWERVMGIPLKIRGTGPLEDRVGLLARNSMYQVSLIPRVAKHDLMALLKKARFLIWPSLGNYETFGLVAVEAFACGIPVIASRLGSMAEIVEDGKTGLHFTAGDEVDLVAKVEWAWTHPQEMEAMGRAARREYDEKYTSAANYKRLMEIYEMVLSKAIPAMTE